MSGRDPATPLTIPPSPSLPTSYTLPHPGTLPGRSHPRSILNQGLNHGGGPGPRPTRGPTASARALGAARGPHRSHGERLSDVETGGAEGARATLLPSATEGVGLRDSLPARHHRLRVGVTAAHGVPSGARGPKRTGRDARRAFLASECRGGRRNAPSHRGHG